MGTSRSRRAAAPVALATVVSGLVLGLGAAPAHAEWSEPGNLVHLRVCKQEAPGKAPGWVFLARAEKRRHTEDARAGMAVLVDGDRRQHWGSGWLGRHGVGRGWIRTRRTDRVTLEVRQEAGDRDSAIGTAQERRVLRLGRIARCD